MYTVFSLNIQIWGGWGGGGANWHPYRLPLDPSGVWPPHPRLLKMRLATLQFEIKLIFTLNKGRSALKWE